MEESYSTTYAVPPFENGHFDTVLEKYVRSSKTRNSSAHYTNVRFLPLISFQYIGLYLARLTNADKVLLNARHDMRRDSFRMFKTGFSRVSGRRSGIREHGFRICT